MNLGFIGTIGGVRPGGYGALSLILEVFWSLLGGSWDVVSKVVSTLIRVISNYKYRYL